MASTTGKKAPAKPARAPEKPATKTAAAPAKKEESSPATRPFDPWSILVYPHLTEKSTSLVEPKNTLVFMARRQATKSQIQQAVEQAFDVKVQKVTALITMTGQKKAYIRLDPKYKAIDITTRLGMV